MNSIQALLNRLQAIFFKNSNEEETVTFEQLVALSKHWDGYKRENAVLRLGMLGNPLAIPYLLSRANDWVPQVREATFKSLTRLVTNENIDVLIECLPQIYHLRNCGRANHDKLISVIEMLLLESRNKTKLVKNINNPNSYVARLCLKLAIENEVAEVSKLLEVSFSSRDVLVRVNAYNWAEQKYPIELEKHHTRLLRDSFMPIRKEALRQSLLGSDAIKLAESSLLDRHSSIRELALKFYLENGGNAVAFYRLNLTEGSKAKAAVWGLGFLNSYDALDEIKSLFESGAPSIRKQALNSLLKLDSQNSESYLFNGLTDSSPSVSKEAARLIVKNRLPLCANKLLQIIEESEYTHTIFACVALSHQINKWERVVFLLSMLINEQALSVLTEEQVEAELGIWNGDYNRSFSQPTEQQIAQIEALVGSPRVNRVSRQFDSLIHAVKSMGIDKPILSREEF
ncbi:HEAT repeat domain-containing protein [Pseudoalteromonas phenolica]|uniref:HEAT repeat domain-containing protein n=1 Tax=Pseudoalteromonas phenolica TaxID=161398 RepID=UPI0013EE4C98|nr:HEAT repeat domain-containing protein [Pseudoalteromonas phenolica]